MSIIAIVAVIILAAALYKTVKQQRTKHDALVSRVARDYDAQRKINERLAKEQGRQAAQLAKHEEEIRKMKSRAEQADADIEHLNSTLDELYAMLDYLKLEQSGTTPGGKEYVKYQNKIISLENRVHSAETRLAKAKHTKAEAERKLS